jgi:hypothetical protein
MDGRKSQGPENESSSFPRLPPPLSGPALPSVTRQGDRARFAARCAGDRGARSERMFFSAAVRVTGFLVAARGGCDLRNSRGSRSPRSWSAKASV